jgi:uncharacterized protein YajQ (UPF0234 family)
VFAIAYKSRICPTPSFDVVSEVDMHELTNAVDQASREITNRFDFKGVDAKFELKDKVITLSAEAEPQLNRCEMRSSTRSMVRDRSRFSSMSTSY